MQFMSRKKSEKSQKKLDNRQKMQHCNFYIKNHGLISKTSGESMNSGYGRVSQKRENCGNMRNG